MRTSQIMKVHLLKYKPPFQKKRMPDGRNGVAGNEVIFKNVNRKHSGTYVCEGSNGSGLVANDSITVDVLRKSGLSQLT